jgi:hypothetical protein
LLSSFTLLLLTVCWSSSTRSCCIDLHDHISPSFSAFKCTSGRTIRLSADRQVIISRSEYILLTKQVMRSRWDFG